METAFSSGFEWRYRVVGICPPGRIRHPDVARIDDLRRLSLTAASRSR